MLKNTVYILMLLFGMHIVAGERERIKRALDHEWPAGKRSFWLKKGGFYYAIDRKVYWSVQGNFFIPGQVSCDKLLLGSLVRVSPSFRQASYNELHQGLPTYEFSKPDDLVGLRKIR